MSSKASRSRQARFLADRRGATKSVAKYATAASSTSLGLDWTSLDRILFAAVTAAWALGAVAISTRKHFVSTYHTLATLSPALEFIGASLEVFLMVAGLATVWIVRAQRSDPAAIHDTRQAVRWLALASLPTWMIILRGLGLPLGEPTIYEPLWLAFFTGIAFSSLYVVPQSLKHSPLAGLRFLPGLIVGCATALSAVWWYYQSSLYYNNFQLGFNDFGHFTQRIASTAAGRGFLLESPVLPPFWDHFNPGILVLVPLWKLFPSVHLIFAVQAVCLAIGGILVWRLARALGTGDVAAALWGIAWLLHPSLGQMNLAYTYGWHPVSLSMPALLIALQAVVKRRRVLAICMTVLACSMEENIFVIVGLFASVRAVRALWMSRTGRDPFSLIDGGLSGRAWMVVAITCFISFALVYRYSGFAEFQSGRFVALGGTPLEIMLSPILRPSVFWGQVFRERTFFFVSGLLVPFFALALARGWWLVLPVVVPLGVLIVWDHFPAQSLAFQYAANLLPILWTASLVGSLDGQHRNTIMGPAQTGLPEERDGANSRFTRSSPSTAYAMGAVSTGLLLSIYLGQFPWSSPTIQDVLVVTYPGATPEHSRRADQPDGQWLAEVTRHLQEKGDTVLATGRIASHLVGCEEVETVGQYIQRRDDLMKLNPNQAPIRRYATIVLDLQEAYQQKNAETSQVMDEATANGFKIIERRFEVIVLERQ